MNRLSALLQAAAYEPAAPLDLAELRRRARRRRRLRHTIATVSIIVLGVSVGAVTVNRLRGHENRIVARDGEIVTHATARYQLNGINHLSFDYPASWTPTEFHYPRGIPAAYDYAASVYLSTQTLSYPCHTQPPQSIAGGSGIDCGLPLRTLERGGVFVQWREAKGGETAYLDRAGPPPSTVRVDRHVATLQITRGGLCKVDLKLRADVTILGSILDRYGYGTATFSFMACLRSPIKSGEAQVRAMLASARVDD